LIANRGIPGDQITDDIVVTLWAAHLDLPCFQSEVIDIQALIDCRHMADRKVQNHKPSTGVDANNFARKTVFRGHNKLLAGPRPVNRSKEIRVGFGSRGFNLTGSVMGATSAQNAQANQPDQASHSISKVVSAGQVNRQFGIQEGITPIILLVISCSTEFIGGKLQPCLRSM
jgi:hypothetical protein